MMIHLFCEIHRLIRLKWFINTRALGITYGILDSTAWVSSNCSSIPSIWCLSRWFANLLLNSFCSFIWLNYYNHVKLGSTLFGCMNRPFECCLISNDKSSTQYIPKEYNRDETTDILSVIDMIAQLLNPLNLLNKVFKLKSPIKCWSKSMNSFSLWTSTNSINILIRSTKALKKLSSI